MLTDKDIEKLMSVLATKKDVRGIQEDVYSFRETVQNLTVAVDKLATVIDTLRIEYGAIKVELERHERWTKQVAKKAKVSLEM